MNIRKLTFTAVAIALTLTLLIPTSVFAQTPPIVSTLAATNVTTNSATLNGNLTDLGTATPVIVSFEYGTTTAYGTTTIPESMGGPGIFNYNLTGLSPGTLYHFRAKAVGDGMGTGDDMTFTTAVIAPTVTTTDNATNITANSATVSGNLTDLGTATTANVSFEYGTTTSYGSTTTAQAMTATGAFSANLIGLTPNTTYHLRAKADGGVHGTANGTDTTFTTLTTPTVVTGSATDITTNSATLNGNLTSLGTAATVIVSFEYGETTSYGETTLVESFSGTGTFSYYLPGLNPGTLYHFRAKAVGDGTATGADMTFTTVASLAVDTGSATNIGFNSATLNGNLISLGAATTVSVFFEYGTTTSYGSNTTAQVVTATGTFSYNLTGLTQETTYYFRAKVDGGEHGTAVGTDMTFDTLKPLTVSTSAATFVTTKEATLNGNLISLGLATTVNVFFEYGETTSYGRTTALQAKTVTGEFSYNLIGLDPGTTYHFRAWGNAGAHGEAWGADVTFATVPPMTPVVDTLGSASVTATSAMISGNLTSLGSALGPDDTVEVFFEYGPNTSYGSIITIAPPMTDTGVFTAEITGLSPETTYHFRAGADGGEHGIGVGASANFTTLTPTTPVVRSSPATGVTSVNATLNGELIHLGSATTANISFEYGTTTSYGSTTALQAKTAPCTFSANLTGLSPGTDYHFRAVADGGAYGIANGADKTFRTLLPIPPVVDTGGSTNVSTTSANVSGNLTSLGTTTTVDVFFEYGTTISYGSTTTAQTMNDTGAFSANLTGLSLGTTYHFRAKADAGVHGKGTGASANFTTLAPIPPVVDTGGSTNVSTTSANVSGNLTSLGTATTVDVFFEYGTDTSYGSTTTAQAMTVTGVFSANLTGLSSRTTYHFRAKANAGVYGKGAGASANFTTVATPLAVSTTDNATNITANSATVSGNLTSLGTATTANVSFKYGTTTSYGSNTTAQAKTVAGTFTADITGLADNTTYHFRAYADGGTQGTATGADMTFTTLTTTPPVVTTSAATSVTSSTATVSGNLTSLGTATTVNVFFEYGTTTSYGSNTTAQAMTGTGTFSVNISGLADNTTYHFRSYADGGTQGTATGADMSFTTTVEEEEEAAAGGGGGGGGGPRPGETYVSSYVTSKGEFISTVVAKSDDAKVKLTIDKGVVGKTKTGRRLQKITITEVTEPPVPPADSSIVGLTYDLGPDGATFDPPIILTFKYDTDELPEGANEENLVIARWDEDASEWVVLEGCTVNPVTQTITAPVGHFTAFTVMASTRPAAFTTSALSISPAEVETGESITISVLVSNTSDLADSYEVVLEIDDVAVASEDIDVAGGGSQQVTFTIARDVAGTCTVNINGLSGTFTVKMPPAPAPFTTSGLTISPAEVETGESVTISIIVANTGDLTGSYKVILSIDNVAVATEDVDLVGGDSQIITFTIARDAARTYTVNINGLSGTFTVKMPPAPAPFTTSGLTISPTEVETGESVTISIIVANTGDLTGSYKVILSIDNVVVASEGVDLAGGDSQQVTFTIAKDVAGTYTVNIDGLSGAFTVKPQTNWGLIGSIILGCVAVALLGYFLAWRKRRGENRIVRTYVVSPLGSGKYAMIIEYGVRIAPTKGFHVGVNMNVECTDVKSWFYTPNDPLVNVIETGIIKKFAEQDKPQMYNQKSPSLNITTQTSYYWYFEANEPLKVQEVLFLDYDDLEL